MTTARAGAIPEWTLADRLRKAREHVELGKVEFADEIGVARNTVSSAENGRHRPSKLVVKAWAMRTGVPYEWIMTGQAPDTPDPTNPCLSGCEGKVVPWISHATHASRYVA